MSHTDVAQTQESRGYEGGVLLPYVDVFEDASGITLYADLPGVPKDKLSVRVEANTLNIEGEVCLPHVEAMEASHVEVPYPRYQRSFTLGQELDREKVVAEMKQGVLKLYIPKVEEVKPRKIQVQIA